jgi:hypothetical protein
LVWDPTKPATNADLLSPEIRGNFAALDAAIMALLAAGPASALVLIGAGGAAAKLDPGTAGYVLTMVSGAPAWAAATGGGKPPLPLPLEQATLPDGTGTGNNPPELIREVSTGTQTTNTPKRTRTFAKFDAATDEHLEWGRSLPADYVSGGTLRGKWKAATATTGAVMWKGGICFTTDGATVDSAIVFTAADAAAAATAPGTLGQTGEFTIPLTMTGAAANREFTVFLGRDADHASDTMAGDAVLVSLRLEYA